MQQPESFADGAQGNLADQRHDRRVGRVGRGECGAGVQKPRSGNNCESLGPAGRQRGAERHIGCALLVPRLDGRKPVLRVVQGVEKIVVLDAGQAIEPVDPVLDQRFDDEMGDGVGHGFGLGQRGLAMIPLRVPLATGVAGRAAGRSEAIGRAAHTAVSLPVISTGAVQRTAEWRYLFCTERGPERRSGKIWELFT